MDKTIDVYPFSPTPTRQAHSLKKVRPLRQASSAPLQTRFRFLVG